MLVWRRAGSARSLLLAATLAALIATALLAGLAGYNQSVIIAGARSAVAAAPALERSLLVQGPGKPESEQTLRRLLPGWSTWAAGYASGRAFGGPTGAANEDSQGVVYASIVYLDGIKEHGRIIEGQWPTPGGGQAVIGAAAARILGLEVGSEVPIVNRRTSKTDPLTISGVFEPKDPDNAFWLLTPEIGGGVTLSGSTYGPLVLDRSDFLAGGWDEGGGSGWIAQPELSGIDLADLIALRDTTEKLVPQLPEAMGMGSGGQAYSSIGSLVDRIQRADLVGRSALLTPLLLIVVLGGYALLLLSGLLTEQRRPETALLRARGADRGQLGWLAAQEGLLVAVPAVLIVAPFYRWDVAIAAGAGCVLAMVLPAMRHGATYVDDLAARSRPSKATTLQRAGADLILVALAVLAWFQLRQYSSPLSGVGGQLGIDPLLASATPIGVLAASVVALRLLPPLTGLAERLIDKRSWFAAQMGMWQAGRRPHAGPVLLLALAVAISTLAWALAGTAERSMVDQANHQAGADLRLTETSGFAPEHRGGEVSALPGVKTVLPVWRTTTSLGERSIHATLLAMDADKAADVVKLRSDLGDVRKIFADLVAGRASGSVPALATPSALAALHKKVGDTVRMSLGDGPVTIHLLASAPTLPGTDGGPAILLDRLSLRNAIEDHLIQQAEENLRESPGAVSVRQVHEWWIDTESASHAQAAAAAGQLAHIRVYDRIAMARQAGEDPYGVGSRTALFIAAFGAIALALVGVAVDVRATARRRLGELAVLHTLGARPRLLARALITEQGFLAGLGVAVGITVGIGVAATMAPLVILTPTAARPDPEPLLSLDWQPVLGTAAGLLLLATAMAGTVAMTMRQRLAAAQLRIGGQA